MARAVIFGCAGPALASAERRFLASADPWGFILFARNVETPAQLARLTAELRGAVGRDAPVLIDQEGGRVARLRAPEWREWAPALDECARLPERGQRARAMYLRYRLIASELAAVGIDVNCAPVLDLVGERTHPVIRSRCYSDDPAEVAEIGRAVATGLLDAGVLPVIKHIPGQGKAGADSHLALPRVQADAASLATDFAPFRALADLPMAMTAHVVYAALDPAAPATQSATVIRLIREEIGFAGLLMTDDLSMKALDGDFDRRATRALDAGCDIVLHCNGDSKEMAAVAEAVPTLAGLALSRAEAALSMRGRAADDAAGLAEEFAAIGGRAHA
jgi:beta-N-acetylhexosaminidase